jgi:hypothetical protein
MFVSTAGRDRRRIQEDGSFGLNSDPEFFVESHMRQVIALAVLLFTVSACSFYVAPRPPVHYGPGPGYYDWCSWHYCR